MTYGEVLERVCKLANYLKSIGVGKGSDVTIYMPMIPELPITMASSWPGSIVPFLHDNTHQQQQDFNAKLPWK